MKFTFKSYKSGRTSSEDITLTSSSNPQQKRRDQVRRAQRTHRERKEVYVKSLEQEVIQLRANEARIMQETRELYAQIGNLKRLLSDNGIQVTPEKLQARQEFASVQDIPDGSFELSIETIKSQAQQRQQRIQAKRAGSNNELSDDRREGQSLNASLREKGITQLDNPPRYLSPFPPRYPSAATTKHALPLRTVNTRLLVELDLTTVGMNFILSLESPCLAHNIPTSQDSPTGHALTVSAALLHDHPAPLQQRSLPSDNTVWEVSSLGIERLLQLSSSVPLNCDEITPVQAWDSIRKHPEFGHLDVERLERLKEKLLESVKCYGFGGVIEQGRFNDAVFETFVVGRVF